MPPHLLIAPLEALMDPRLTEPERRVLLSLYSFRNKNADTVWPSIESIAMRSNITDKTRISKITSSLASKGWLTKKRRGFTGGNQYTLLVPVEAEEYLSKLDSETNLEEEAKLEDKPKLDRDTLSKLDSDTNTNLDSDTKYKEQQREQQKEQEADKVRQVFDYWSEVMSKPRARLTNDKREKIRARLRDGFTVAEMKQAIDGCKASAFHMGANDSGKQYNEIGLIFRNGEKVESFIAGGELKTAASTGGLEI